MPKCAECTYLEVTDDHYYGAFWCSKKYERHLATDPECDRFCRAYGRSDSTIRNAISCSNNHNSGGGCYLTTMLCNILGMDDNNIYMQTMRNFRNNILQKNESYKNLLIEYDIVGPKIAKALEDDPLKEKIAKMYFEKSIVPICELINNSRYKAAVCSYLEMTASLKNFYGLHDYSVTIEEINNADIEKSGHGKYIKKKITL